MDRTKAVEVLTKMRECEDIDFCDSDCFKCRLFARDVDRTNALNMAIKALEGKDTNVPAKWIPVSERLPEEGQRCLVCDNGWFSIDTFVGHGNPYNWKLYVRDYEAWMPLPEPYKEGEQNG